MPDDKSTVPTEQPSSAPLQVKEAPRGACPRCGGNMSRAMFRSGSMEHPGHDVMVCDRCGSRR